MVHYPDIFVMQETINVLLRRNPIAMEAVRQSMPQYGVSF